MDIPVVKPIIMGRAGTPPSAIVSRSHTSICLGHPIRAATQDKRDPGTRNSTLINNNLKTLGHHKTDL